MHQPRRRHQQPLPHRPAQGATIGLLQQMQADVVELDDEPHQAVDPHCHQYGNARHHRQLQCQAGSLHGAEGDDDDLGREDEIGANGPLHLLLLKGNQIIGNECSVRLPLARLMGQKLVGQLLGPLETEVGAPQHQERGDEPGHQGADGDGSRHQNKLVAKRPLGHRPHHRQLPLGAHPGDLLGVEGQIVPQHPGGLLRRHLGHQRHIVEYAGNIVNQGQQTGSGHIRESLCQ